MEVLEKVLDILTTPIVIGGVGTLTLGSAIALILKAILGAKKGDVINLQSSVKALQNNELGFATKDDITKLQETIKKQNALQKDLISSLKNEKVKEQLELERQEIENDFPSESVEIVEEVVEEKKARF